MWTYTAGPILSLLPTRWRDAHLWQLQIRWLRAAIVPGLIEAIACGYFAWNSPSRIITSCAAYFCVEGIVRFYAGLPSGEGLGSFPLIAIADLCRIAKRSAAPALLPLVRDEVLPGDASCDLKIATSRKQPDWRYPYTVHYAGAYFQITGHVVMPAGPRPFVYSLNRLQAGEIARGLKEYSPDDILTRVQPIAPVMEN